MGLCLFCFDFLLSIVVVVVDVEAFGVTIAVVDREDLPACKLPEELWGVFLAEEEDLR